MNIKPKKIKWGRTNCDGITIGKISGRTIFEVCKVRGNGGYNIFSPPLVPHGLQNTDKPTKLIEAKRYCQGRLMNEIFHLLFEKD